MTESIRVRFAPSPTGYPHVGNIRTALFNWLFARHHGGVFILRIEDTDVERKVDGAVEAIQEGLQWLGLDWDEGPGRGGDYGPYFQSQRLETYRSVAQRLVEGSHAYLCYCSPQQLEEMRAEQVRRKQPPGYDRRCRNLDSKDRAEREAQGIRPVVRFKTPLEGQTRFRDLLRGEVVFENSTLDDFVLLKSDGYPTYNFANVVDDHLMQISHVLRADEFVASTPRHTLLYHALGYQPPEFAHLPMILGPDHSKLSKRHGAVSVMEYQQQGYLPEVLANFLALLGWSLDDKTELLTLDELVKFFSLERVSRTAAVFNVDKLNWMNGVYLRRLTVEEFTRRAVPFLERGLPQIGGTLPAEYVSQIMPLVQERTKTLDELPELVGFFFSDDTDYDISLLEQAVTKRQPGRDAEPVLRIAWERLKGLDAFDAVSLEALLRPLAKELELKTGELFGLLRVATTGRTAAPPLFQTMAVLGRERCLGRIEAGLHRLQADASA